MVVCPECGHRQDEPCLVVSTICRRCRSHIEVRNGNVVTPAKNSAQGPNIGLPSDQRPPPDSNRPRATPPATLRVRNPQADDEPAPPVTRSAPALPPTLRVRNPHTEEPPPEPPPRPQLPPTLRIRTKPADDFPDLPPPQPLPVPPTLRIRHTPDDEGPAGSDSDPDVHTDPATPHKPGLLERLLRPVPPRRDVLCVECGRRFQTPGAAATTNCPTCGCYMSLRDFTIAEPSSTRIQTRGNVTITRKGHVSGNPLECHDLAVHGTLETGATCSGDLVITSSGLFRGKLRCERLIIEKRARVEFIHPIETGEAVINGHVTGSIRARRSVTLLKRSRLRGNITATNLILKQGAAHSGLLRIIATPPPPPEESP